MPLTSFVTDSIDALSVSPDLQDLGLIGAFASEMNNTPSGPKSPNALHSVDPGSTIRSPLRAHVKITSHFSRRCSRLLRGSPAPRVVDRSARSGFGLTLSCLLTSRRPPSRQRPGLRWLRTSASLDQRPGQIKRLSL